MNSKCKVKVIVLAVLLVATTLVVSACRQPLDDTSSTTEETMTTDTNGLVTSANDGWRYYSFDPQSIRSWTDEEGIDVIDVMITVNYKDNPGNSARDDQLWHIDKTQNRYRVSDTISYDLEGKACEVWPLPYDMVSWRPVEEGSTIEQVLDDIYHYMEAYPQNKWRTFRKQENFLSMALAAPEGSFFVDKEKIQGY